ncbi:MAG TPA: hypothetical protein VGD53_29165 [Actinoallomurus sp.]|jgi:hypothetical protein
MSFTPFHLQWVSATPTSGEPTRRRRWHADGERLRWTAQQTYLNPFPSDLRHRLWSADASELSWGRV